MDLCPIHYVATQRRGASRRKRGGGGGRGGVPSPTRAGIDPGACICRYLRRVYRATSRCLLATYYRTPPSLRGDTLMTGGPPTRISLAQGHSVTEREREKASRGNGCFRIFGSNHAGLGSEEGSFFRGILLRFLSFFSF